MEKYQELILKIEAKFGGKITKPSDLKILQHQINSYSDKELSYNTLRRFFGFLPATNPSLTTVNILSRYLGYSDFYNFTHLQDFSDWEIWIKMTRLKQKDKLIKSDIIYLNHHLNSSSFILYLLDLLQHYFYKRDIATLKKLFSLQWDKLERPDILKVSVSIGLTLREIYKTEASFIKQLVTITNFRNVVIYNFIDYTYLNSGYLTLLKRCKEIEKNNDDQLFLAIVMLHAKFLNGRKIRSNQLKYGLEDYSSTYPIVKGRFFAFQFAVSSVLEQNAVYTEMIKYCTFLNKCEFFFEVIPTLILLKRIDLIEQIFELYHEDIFEINKSNRLTHQGLFQIGIALVSIKNNKNKLAKKELESVRYDLAFDSYLDYTRLFYLIAEYNISKEKSNIEQEYKGLAKKLKMKRFSLELLKNYF